MKKKIIVLAITTIFSSFGWAQSESEGTYQYEVGALYSKTTDVSGLSNSLSGVGGNYYFKPVQLNVDEPAFEHEFVQRVSNIGLQYGSGNLSTSSIASTNFPNFDFNGSFYLGDLIVAIDYTAFSKSFPLKSNTSYAYKINETQTSLALGYFVLPKSSLALEYTSQNATYSRNTASITSLNDLKNTTTSIVSKTIFDNVAGAKFIVLNVNAQLLSYQQTSSYTEHAYGFNVSYYPIKNAYALFGYSTEKGSDISNIGNEVSAGLGYEITPRFAVSLLGNNFNASNSTAGYNSQSRQALVTYRF